MSEINRILDQLDRAYSGEAWHGPSLRNLLEGISAEDASQHSIHNAHSIWELVNHVAAWHVIVARRLAGESPEVTQEMDWPPVWEASEVSWIRTLEHLAESYKRVRQTAAKLRDDQLDQKLTAKGDSFYMTLHGLIQHDLYHAGQIAILKKALERGKAALA
ncbi:MAG TPA: DinB family protein [Candidatus Limnocylindria bacterium]|nr:DinB family protein [Candidatus Limnocylindria bacterium]